MLTWPLRRWLVAGAASVAVALLIAVPTDLLDTPLFGREIPPTWWAWPALAVTSILAGLLTATYVAEPDLVADDRRARRGGYAGTLLTFFAVGCPVCNKLVLVALGSAGAISWFQPAQPALQALALALLAWALARRTRRPLTCPVPPAVSPGAAAGSPSPPSR